ncbi:MAG: hypothetical protein C0631_18550 [Sedimenticola sp.]|nr:MAG: hypothetical protein C0631_18550 [Sedimenticola sp.]
MNRKRPDNTIYGKRLRGIFLFILLVVSWPVGLAAQAGDSEGLTVNELIELQNLGFTEETIKQELSKSSTDTTFTESDVDRLRKAGFSPEFIDFLGSRALRRRLYNNSVGAMLTRGLSLEAILKEIQQNDHDFDTSPRALLDFHKRFQASTWLIYVMRGHAIDLEKIKAMAHDKLPVSTQLLIINTLGVDSGAVKLETAQMLNLLQAGVPAEIVRYLRDAEKSGGMEASMPHAGYYPHVLDLFKLRYPPDWQLLKDIDGDYVSYTLTPEKNVPDPDDLEVAFQLLTSPLDPESIMSDMTPSQVIQQMLPMVLEQEPGLRPVGDVLAIRLGELPAAKLQLVGTVSDKVGQYRGDMVLAFREGQMILVVSMSPENLFTAYKPQFDQILQKSSFLTQVNTARQPEPLPAQKVVENHKTGIVSITSYRGDQAMSYGTGFVVREDGYLLTNHHVIWDDEKDQPATRFTAEWDSDTGIQKAEAELVGYRWAPTYQQLVRGMSWGIDIALLKLPDGRHYKPLPLVSTREIQLADPVLTLGFPDRGRIETLSTIVTSGIVTRLNKDFTGQLESIYVDAPIAHGSSGGPSFDLMHGRVFGQNTFGSFGIKGKENLWNYFGVIPIDYALAEYPLATLVSKERDQYLDPAELYDVALHSRAKGATEGALMVAQRALKAAPDSADTHYLVGRLRLEQAKTQEDVVAGLKQLDIALSVLPDHQPTLMFLAQACLELGDTKKARGYADRLVAAHPKESEAYEMRARVFLVTRSFDQALVDLEKAKQLTQKVIPSPYLLAGETYYSMKHYGEGKREFEEALRIQPDSLDARLGIARYYQSTDKLVGALLEYNKINDDMPGYPAVLSALGDAYQALAKPDKALESYLQSIERSQKLGNLPQPATYLKAAQSAQSKQVENPDRALLLYLQMLANYWGQESALEAHLGISRLLKDYTAYHAIALGHLIWAQELRANDQEVVSLMGRYKEARLSYDVIKAMINELGYPPVIAGLVISKTPLDFQTEITQELLSQLQKELPQEVMAGILLSIEKYPGRTHQTVQGSMPNSLIGSWTSLLYDETSGSYSGALTLVLDASGRYVMQVQTGNQVTSEQGTAKVVGTTLQFTSDAGEMSTHGFVISENQLVIAMDESGEMVFARTQ